MENEDGQSSNTCNDQDSNISFKNDTDDEIDMTVIEEENWIDSTEKEAQTEPWKRWKMRRFDVGTRLIKNEMETGAENSIYSESEMDSESC